MITENAPADGDTLKELADRITDLEGAGGGPQVLIESGSATVSAAAADSGKYFRLTHTNAVFNLPTTGLVAGLTEFFLTFAQDGGTVDAGTGNIVETSINDSGTFTNSQPGNQTAVGVNAGVRHHVKYFDTGRWASTFIIPA